MSSIIKSLEIEHQIEKSSHVNNGDVGRLSDLELASRLPEYEQSRIFVELLEAIESDYDNTCRVAIELCPWIPISFILDKCAENGCVKCFKSVFMKAPDYQPWFGWADVDPEIIKFVLSMGASVEISFVEIITKKMSLENKMELTRLAINKGLILGMERRKLRDLDHRVFEYLFHVEKALGDDYAFVETRVKKIYDILPTISLRYHDLYSYCCNNLFDQVPCDLQPVIKGFIRYAPLDLVIKYRQYDVESISKIEPAEIVIANILRLDIPVGKYCKLICKMAKHHDLDLQILFALLEDFGYQNILTSTGKKWVIKCIKLFYQHLGDEMWNLIDTIDLLLAFRFHEYENLLWMLENAPNDFRFNAQFNCQYLMEEMVLDLVPPSIINDLGDVPSTITKIYHVCVKRGLNTNGLATACIVPALIVNDDIIVRRYIDSFDTPFCAHHHTADTYSFLCPSFALSVMMQTKYAQEIFYDNTGLNSIGLDKHAVWDLFICCQAIAGNQVFFDKIVGYQEYEHEFPSIHSIGYQNTKSWINFMIDHFFGAIQDYLNKQARMSCAGGMFLLTVIREIDDDAYLLFDQHPTQENEARAKKTSNVLKMMKTCLEVCSCQKITEYKKYLQFC